MNRFTYFCSTSLRSMAHRTTLGSSGFGSAVLCSLLLLANGCVSDVAIDEKDKVAATLAAGIALPGDPCEDGGW